MVGEVVIIMLSRTSPDVEKKDAVGSVWRERPPGRFCVSMQLFAPCSLASQAGLNVDALCEGLSSRVQKPSQGLPES